MDDTALTELLTADGETAVERLDHWAEVAGDKPFFYYGEDDLTLTYAEFGRRTDAIAGNLKRLGVHKGDPVSVFTTNPLAAALAMFGVWKAGAVYSPVNFAYTGRLLTYQLDDTAPAMVITDAKLIGALNDVAPELASAPQVCVYEPAEGAHDHVPHRPPTDGRFTDVAWSRLTAEAARPQVTIAAHDPANIVYTSGTTGPAKGVLQPHRWMNQYTFAFRRTLTPDDVVYNDLPLYHVGGAVENVVRAAWAGCTVAVWDRFSPSEFWRRIERSGATTAILLDVMIPWLVKAPESPRDQDNTLNKVYMQPFPANHAEVARRFGFDFVLGGFGQTESGNPLAVYVEECAPGEGTPADTYVGLDHAQITERAGEIGVQVLGPREADRRGLMGLPTPLFEVAVLDDSDNRCAPGKVGELAFRPKLPSLLFTEYLGKPEATVRAWRNLWFHTGDSAVETDDGAFAFVDRLGDRIRVRGENLSSFQVEEVMNGHDAIALVTAFPIPSAEGDEDDIVVYATPAEGSSVTAEELQEYATRNMPKYMRPRHIRIVDEIPRTPTNKIEKYKLRGRILGELGRDG
ncbi:AMP-binding protein [Tomitella gaofuii]|uniref:AMP-binding protein n=1 Tax=Tomitella gaofuii TaxID=2760083 RepID=UPI0015F937D7|nr:AMP-binding protein [Tomitella gaofuii]